MTERIQLIIGSYTGRLPYVHCKAHGVLGSWLDDRTPGLAPTVLGPARNPSYVALSSNGKHIHKVNEVAGDAAVTTFSRAPRAQGLPRPDQS